MRIRAAMGFVCAAAAWSQVRPEFDEESRLWTLSNGLIEARFQLGFAGTFASRGLLHKPSGKSWMPAADQVSSPIRMRIGDRWIDETSMFRLIRQWAEPVSRGGIRQTILLDESRGLGQVVVELEMYPNSAALRYGVRYRNSGAVPVVVSEADPLRWRFDGESYSFRAIRAEQWLAAPGANPADFEQVQSELDSDGEPLVFSSGAHERFCSWLAVSRRDSLGLAFGWEFNGRMSIELRHWMARNRLQLSGSIPELHHRVEPGDDFQVPRAFIALYQGGPDDAGWVTQRFVEEVLAKPVQDPRFPYVSWDSWAYGQAIDEKRLRESAETAARAGVELFIVDLGWANSIGDWHADPAKFPSGLRALSDHVHTLGMKFGLHFAWSHASPNSPVLRGHPDWVASRDSLYYGASSLCLGHKPVREWIVSETLRMIDEYGVDWILQDGENMVKHCQSRSHTHHPDDSNYANSVDGLDAVLREVQKARPHVLWENCENGGNMMTYQMVQQYVTSIVNDASGARASRLAVYGATFPFPPRYTDRYMPEQRIDAYTARSYEFGGPWILMNRLAQLDPQSRAYLTREIERYKQARSFIRDAKVLHLTGPPAEGGIDAIAAHDPSIDTVIAFVTRDGGPLSDFALRVGSLDPERTYLVRFADDGRALTLTGVQIGSQGINVLLPEERYSEVVYIAPLETAPRLFDSRGPR